MIRPPLRGRPLFWPCGLRARPRPRAQGQRVSGPRGGRNPPPAAPVRPVTGPRSEGTMRDDHKGDRKDAYAKLWSMIKGIQVAMLTSWDGHRMHTRPMHVYQEEFSGELWFFTKLD